MIKQSKYHFISYDNTNNCPKCGSDKTTQDPCSSYWHKTQYENKTRAEVLVSIAEANVIEVKETKSGKSMRITLRPLNENLQHDIICYAQKSDVEIIDLATFAKNAKMQEELNASKENREADLYTSAVLARIETKRSPFKQENGEYISREKPFEELQKGDINKGIKSERISILARLEVYKNGEQKADVSSREAITNPKEDEFFYPFYDTESGDVANIVFNPNETELPKEIGLVFKEGYSQDGKAETEAVRIDNPFES